MQDSGGYEMDSNGWNDSLTCYFSLHAGRVDDLCKAISFQPPGEIVKVLTNKRFAVAHISTKSEVEIPAGVGCGNTTMNLKTGDRIRVDGGKGTAELM